MLGLAETILDFVIEYDKEWENRAGPNPWFDRKYQFPREVVLLALNTINNNRLTYAIREESFDRYDGGDHGIPCGRSLIVTRLTDMTVNVFICKL